MQSAEAEVAVKQKSPWQGRLGIELIKQTKGCCADAIIKWRPHNVGERRSCAYCGNLMKTVRACEGAAPEYTGMLNEIRKVAEEPDLVIGGLFFSASKFTSEEMVKTWFEERELAVPETIECDGHAFHVGIEGLIPDTMRSVWVANGVVGEIGIAEKQTVTGGGQGSMQPIGITTTSMASGGTVNPIQSPAAGAPPQMFSVLHGFTDLNDGHQHEFYLAPRYEPDGWRVSGFTSYNNGHVHMIDASLNADGSLDTRTNPDQEPVGGHAHSHKVRWIPGDVANKTKEEAPSQSALGGIDLDGFKKRLRAASDRALGRIASKPAV